MSRTTQVSWYQKIKPIRSLLKQETVRQWHQHPTTWFFTGRMPFLLPNQQRQSTEGRDIRNLQNTILLRAKESPTKCFQIHWMMRRILSLPYNTHSRLVSPICDFLPVREELICRCASFIMKCLNSCNSVVHSVSLMISMVFIYLCIMKFVQQGTQIKTRCEKKENIQKHKKYIMKYIKTI